mgnify:CR=1 FL=1
MAEMEQMEGLSGAALDAMFRALGIPHRVVNVCTGDIGRVSFGGPGGAPVGGGRGADSPGRDGRTRQGGGA